MNEDQIQSFAWELRDERHYQFIARKYHDRRKLAAEADEKRKLADKSETINGKPNPQHPRLCVEAEMAQMRYDMAYMVDKNTQLEQYIETIEFVHQRLGILEGAYGHIKTLVMGSRMDYSQNTDDVRTSVRTFLKEQACKNTSTSGKKSDTSA